MTDVKELPKDIAAIEQTDAFKEIDAAHTVKQLEKKLRDAGVSFLSADNKSDLVWRLLDAQSVQADVPAAPSEKKPGIRIKNTGAFNVLEPASLTLLKAGEITDVFATPKASKHKILANIKQINALRGDNLKIIE